MSDTVRLKDIADAMGISIVTVSNALAGRKGVSDAVRSQICEKAAELGYDSGRRRTVPKADSGGITVGVLVAGRYIRVGISFYWMLYQQLVYAVSGRRGFTMLEIVEDEQERQGQMPRILLDKSIGGLIVIGQVETEYLRRLLETLRGPVVLLDFCCEELPCAAVLSNNYMGMYRMTRYLTERGHRDIGFIGLVEDNDNLCDRYFGYRKGMAEAGLEVRPEWTVAGAEVIRGTVDLRRMQTMPTAFACCSDLVAGFTYDALSQAGFRVPEDISLVGYDNYLQGHPFAKQLTTYNVDMKKMAQLAVKILYKKIQGDKGYFGVHYLDSCVKERSSVRTIEDQWGKTILL